MTEQLAFWETGGRYRPSDHPVVELFARQRVEYLEARGALDGVASLLDVGAGSGFSSAYYPERIRVVACDYASGMLTGNPVRDRVRCSATQLPFDDGGFDVVTCWELLHHLDDPVAALREMWRVTRRRLVVFEPNRINPGHIVLGLTREEERRSLLFSPGHLRRLVHAATGRRARPQRCGLLFPNVTPLPIARLLTRLPYRVPLIAISQLVVLEKD
ncbi:MAG TPA: class I SAM-dependent methyltransferase [Candidatus Binatia bacterium]